MSWRVRSTWGPSPEEDTSHSYLVLENPFLSFLISCSNKKKINENDLPPHSDQWPCPLSLETYTLSCWMVAQSCDSLCDINNVQFRNKLNIIAGYQLQWVTRMSHSSVFTATAIYLSELLLRDKLSSLATKPASTTRTFYVLTFSPDNNVFECKHGLCKTLWLKLVS